MDSNPRKAASMKKPIKVFYSELSGRFYASTAHLEAKQQLATSTKGREDGEGTA